MRVKTVVECPRMGHRKYTMMLILIVKKGYWPVWNVAISYKEEFGLFILNEKIVPCINPSFFTEEGYITNNVSWAGGHSHHLASSPVLR